MELEGFSRKRHMCQALGPNPHSMQDLLLDHVIKMDVH